MRVSWPWQYENLPINPVHGAETGLKKGKTVLGKNYHLGGGSKTLGPIRPQILDSCRVENGC